MITHTIERNAPPRPFQTVADPDLFFASRLHTQLLGRLLLAVEGGKPLAVLTGEPGTGKTAILRRLMVQLERGGLKSVLFRVPATLEDLEASLSAAGSWRHMIVGFDEAQALSDEVLAALPTLLAGRPDLRIILAGGVELIDKLAALEARGTRLPVSVRCQLGPLDREEVGPYIEYCWRKARGGPDRPNPFQIPAVRRIASVSGGVPQIVNVICDRALLLAETRGQATVTPDMVDDVARGLEASSSGLARFVRLSARSPVVQAAMAAVLTIPLLFVGLDLLRRPAQPSRGAPAGMPAVLRSERASVEPPVVAREPRGSVRSEPAGASRPAPEVGGASPGARPVATVARSIPRPTFRLRPAAIDPWHGPARDDALLQHAEDGDIQTVRRLLAEGASPDARDSAGRTPLMLSVIQGHSTIAELLIARGATVNAMSAAGLTPLMFAAINNRPTTLRTLMDQGGNVNVRSRAGWTALTYAAWRGHPEIVRLLLARGADPNVTDRAGWTGLEYARWRAGQSPSSDDLSGILTAGEASRPASSGPGLAEVIELLQRAGAKRDRGPGSRSG